MHGTKRCGGPRTAPAAAPVVGLLFVLAACGPRSDAPPASGERPNGAAAADSMPRGAVAREPAGPARLIRPDGIAHARAGMTIEDLRAALPPGVSLGPPAPFMVDIDAMPVTQGVDTLYLVLVPADEPPGEGEPLEPVATMDTTFRTAGGVGPGTTLGEAASILGQPTLSYNVHDESREYAEFPHLPASILVRTRPAGSPAAFAGEYATADEHNVTRRYDAEAAIWMVLVWLR